MPRRLAETQLTQDNADQYLKKEGDKDEVRELAAVLCESHVPSSSSRKQIKRRKNVSDDSQYMV